jgi:ElaB/YqjD/DUF883 family membrane-anchored ribosome-binding protein
MSDTKSPAVESLENEDKIKRDHPDALDEGLEGTFPASDPVSATTTAILTGTTDSHDASSDAPVSAPLVDEALQSVLKHRNDPYVEPRESAAALGQEVESLAYRGADIADNLRSRVRARPLQAIGIAAVIGFVWGMTR